MGNSLSSSNLKSALKSEQSKRAHSKMSESSPTVTARSVPFTLCTMPITTVQDEPTSAIENQTNQPLTNDSKIPLSALSSENKQSDDSSNKLLSNTVDKNNSNIDIHSGFSAKSRKIISQRQNPTFCHTRYNSVFDSHISDNNYMLFSQVEDSKFTAFSEASHFSINSLMDKPKANNDHIMSAPEDEYSSAPAAEKYASSVENLNTTEQILEVLATNPEFTYDIFTKLLRSERIRSDIELQKAALQAAEVWSLRPDDVYAKVYVACCKLCGWGTLRNSKQGFQELQELANKNVWGAYYYLAQCYYHGVEQTEDASGYTLANGKQTTTTVILAADQQKAYDLYKKVIDTPSGLSSDLTAPVIALAQLRVAVTNFLTGKIDDSNFEENVSHIKNSALAGNRKSEFLFALLLQIGAINDVATDKEYYFNSACKDYTPAQIQLGLILIMREGSNSGLTWLTRAKNLGDPRAYYHLGDVYEFGRCVPVDYAMATNYYLTAADKYNDAASQFRLGMHCFNGSLGLQKDFKKAFIYLSKASQSGHAPAQYLLAFMYRDNKVPSATPMAFYQKQQQQVLSQQDINRNKKEALILFKKAAAQRMHAAIIQTAICYEQGMGTAISHDIAAEYYEIAIGMNAPSLSSAQLSYANFLHRNSKFAKAFELYSLALTTDGTEKADSNVSRVSKLRIALMLLDKDPSTPYKPKEAFDSLLSLIKSNPNDAEIRYWVAVCYEEGINGVVRPDLAQAYENYLVSANLDYGDSQLQVGHMLCQGLGVTEDRLEAFNFFQKAAKHNNHNALYYIGIYYYNGSGSILKDHVQAREYFQKAAKLGHVESMVSFAKMCQEKASKSSLPSSEVECSEAIKWYKKAAAFNHITALRELGNIYRIREDFKTSAEFYEKASNLNDALSTLILGSYYESSKGVEMNTDTALKCYEKAMNLGQPTASFAIAELYEKLQNYADAYRYYKRVVQDAKISPKYKSNSISQLKMALYSLSYEPQTFLSKNATVTKSHLSSTIQKSLKFTETLSKYQAFEVLMNLAESENFTPSFNCIAECYQNGNGVVQSDNKSLYWRCKAVKEAGDANAVLKLAYFYETGTGGVEKNETYSAELYQICNGKNNDIAQQS